MMLDLLNKITEVSIQKMLKIALRVTNAAVILKQLQYRNIRKDYV